MASYRQAKGKVTRSGNFQWTGLDPYWSWQLSQTPILGDFMRAMDQQKYWNDYLRNRGMAWKDVKYPALLGGQTAFGAGFNAGYTVVGAVVSKNLLRLYR